jgi:hypothetical protein
MGIPLLYFINTGVASRTGDPVFTYSPSHILERRATISSLSLGIDDQAIKKRQSKIASMQTPSPESTVAAIVLSSAATLFLLWTISSITPFEKTSKTHSLLQNGSNQDILDSVTTTTTTSSETSSTPEEQSEPMFDFREKQLTQLVLKMATDRAKRWISFQASDCNKMIGQVGGKSVEKRPLLTLEPNVVLKPVNLDHRGIREIAFYEAIETASTRNRRSKNDDTYCQLFGPRRSKPLSIQDKLFSWLDGRSSKLEASFQESSVESETKMLRRLELFTPDYYGVVEYATESSTSEQVGCYGTTYNSHLIMQNLTSHFSKPCVLDLKMGTETYEPDAPQDKKLRERAKYPQQVEFGFRLVGMRIFSPDNALADIDGYIYFSKKFGRSLESRDSVKRALRSFFGDGDLPVIVRANRAEAIKRILTQVKLIKKWFKENDVFTFSASSILLVYEGNTKTDEENEIQPDLATAKMIDFSRVRRKAGGDVGYLHGVRTLIMVLEEILTESFCTDEYTYLQ